MAASGQRVSLVLRQPAGPFTGQWPAAGNALSGAGEIDLSLVTNRPGPALQVEPTPPASP
jgi:glucose-6-phosphate 1-dehydrogenase